MFDANMRYIKRGERFFAEVGSIDKNDKLYAFGLRAGDVVMCHMLNDSPDNPLVDIIICGKIRTTSDSNYNTWIRYAGNIDGKSGFIKNDVKAKANKVLDYN